MAEDDGLPARRARPGRPGIDRLADRHALTLAVEQGFLLLLLVMLPLFESPKAIALAGYLIAAAVRHASFRGLPRPGFPGGAALAFAATAVLSGIVAVAAAGWDDPERLKGTGETVLFALALLAVLCGGYGSAFRRLALWTALAAALAASGWMAAQQWGPGGWDRSLLSLGNVNTGALYLALAGTAAAALLADAAGRGAAAAAVPSAALGLLCLALVDLGSRTGLLAVFAGCGAIIVVALRRHWPYALAGALAALALAVWLRSPLLIEKFGRIGLDGLDGLVGPRAPMWRLGFAAFLEHPLLGVGWRNFRHVDHRALGFAFPPGSESANADHAHNQYLNLLAEGGLIGFAAFFVLLGGLAWRLGRSRPARPAAAPAWLAGAGALVAMLAGGLFEAVVIAEVALLWAVLLGLAAAPPQQQPGPKPRRFRGLR
jgi:O-antigen ligase